MKIKIDADVDVYYDAGDKRIYCAVKYLDLDKKTSKYIGCVSDVIE